MPSDTIFTTSAMKALFRARWAYFCATPYTDRYKHLYEIYKMLVSDEKINDLPEKYGEKKAKEIQVELQKLEFIWIESDRLQQLMDNYNKNNTKMEAGQDRSVPPNEFVKELRKEIRKVCFKMPPMFHMLIEVTLHLINRTDLVNYGVSMQHLEFARGDKLPFKVETEIRDR